MLNVANSNDLVISQEHDSVVQNIVHLIGLTSFSATVIVDSDEMFEFGVLIKFLVKVYYYDYEWLQ